MMDNAWNPSYSCIFPWINSSTFANIFLLSKATHLKSFFITIFSTKLHFYINCILYLFCHSTINSCINLDLKWEKTSWKWKEKTRWNASLQRKFSWQKIEYRQHQAFATKSSFLLGNLKKNCNFIHLQPLKLMTEEKYIRCGIGNFSRPFYHKNLVF